MPRSSSSPPRGVDETTWSTISGKAAVPGTVMTGTLRSSATPEGRWTRQQMGGAKIRRMRLRRTERRRRSGPHRSLKVGIHRF